MTEKLTGWNDTIVALVTPPGIGAIAVIRLSGTKAIDIVNRLFSARDLLKQPSHTVVVGLLENSTEVLDEVVITIYRNPKSYTGEDVVEISCHGSPYVQAKILETIIAQGARMALPGEFTQRAFLKGKMDLAQAEAVADLIAANSKAAQQTALNQLRGGFSDELRHLREQLINFTALIELELDFSQEDVEFADRTQLKELVDQALKKIQYLIQSFQLGNVIKKGVSVAIIGKPNAGKSTLLNALLNEERAIVSDMAGTTRDTIEETININGILFRLIDTAGIRQHATDSIEHIGMERSKENAAKADIVLNLIDITDDTISIDWLSEYASKTIEVYNKYDLCEKENQRNSVGDQLSSGIYISARQNKGIEELKNLLYERVMQNRVAAENTIITNIRHLAALQEAEKSLQAVQEGLSKNLSGDLMTVDIRRALHYLGEITGQVEVDRDILGTIFGKFCIGK